MPTEPSQPATRRVAVLHAGGASEDVVAVEEPMELRIEGIAAVLTMRTPGHERDLAAGFLLGEAVIDGWDDVRAMAQVAENVVDVRLAEGVPAARARSADRALFTSSSCGLCGAASLDRLPHPKSRGPGWVPSDVALAAAVTGLTAAMAAFQQTGGVHGAGLFGRDGALLVTREDIGRHNAVDKVIGARLRSEGDCIGLGLVVSSRAGFEIVQKAVAAGIGCLVVFGAATSLAVDAAAAAELPLIGWAARNPVRYWGGAAPI
ncbi:sulfurtransferase FdhD [Deltaproteobacteria bacterium]|nr:sulfurtransferase FdhD [Deltaproteobacteria bacterium]